MRRTQGERESVVDYLTCMNALFERLSPPWSEEEKIGYAYRNMLPKLQTMVSREAIIDLESLELLAARPGAAVAPRLAIVRLRRPTDHYSRIWRTARSRRAIVARN